MRGLERDQKINDMIKKNCKTCKKEIFHYPSRIKLYCSVPCVINSQEWIENLRQKMTGNTHGLQKGHKINLGRWQGESTRNKIRLASIGRNVGEKNAKWIEDRTKLCRVSKQGERRTSAYFFWRKSVWVRDNWKCKMSNLDCNGKIEAHHILGWKDYPELRYDINNGITLCHFHHPRKRIDEVNLSPYFQELVMNIK